MTGKGPKAERLPGMPGPAQDSVERQERFIAALQEIHDCLAWMMEGMPVGNGRHNTFTHGEKIKGDYIQITFQPGKS